ncbi:TadE/TadG family type IV pilus assembly protein [Variovorax sp.]|jgi:Flp pilus assembly protein TadG|uniref:TadE/TadG family type IV pilus assembly protein n=1 Tax=Variovorax sp. TaxID=1871043 RepID=UPI0025F4A8AB|nr:TadE family protein [Variovorax sp.]
MTARRIARLQCVSRRCQHGLAAIEFALTFTFLFLILYGLATFGALFYTQQVVARSAEEGIRAATSFRSSNPAVFESTIRTAVVDSLEQSLVVPLTATNRRTWITQKVTIAITGTSTSAQVAVTVTYPYTGDSRLLPTVSILDTRWMPQQLRSSATGALLRL